VRPTLIAALAAAGAVAGCGGSKPKDVTKAQYETQVQRLGDELVNTGSQIGQHLDIATFNEDIANFQDELRTAAKDLNGVKPPVAAREPNKRLAASFDKLADELESVKQARRTSLREAAKAFRGARESAAAREGRTAVKQLRHRGYDVGQMASL
jgi:hypothetical protein